MFLKPTNILKIYPTNREGFSTTTNLQTHLLAHHDVRQAVKLINVMKIMACCGVLWERGAGHFEFVFKKQQRVINVNELKRQRTVANNKM